MHEYQFLRIFDTKLDFREVKEREIRDGRITTNPLRWARSVNKFGFDLVLRRFGPTLKLSICVGVGVSGLTVGPCYSILVRPVIA